MSGFVQALAWLDEAESGFTVDQGGPTYRGVTQKRYDEWRVLVKKLPKRDVRQLTPEEREEFYHGEYWMAAKCEALPWPLSLIHFDVAVNSGPAEAVRILQRALGGLKIDGVFGAKTEEAARLADRTALYNNMLWERAELMAFLATQAKHQPSFRGWINRLLKLRRQARATW